MGKILMSHIILLPPITDHVAGSKSYQKDFLQKKGGRMGKVPCVLEV